jgi:hypothetical protein
MGRVKVLAAAAGLLLILKAPALAQYSPENPPAVASSDQDEDQGLNDTAESQALADTDWWWQNEGLTVGYLPGWYGSGSCRSWSQPTWTGRAATQWWNAAGTNSWFPAGQPLPDPYGLGGCGNGNRWRNALLLTNQRLVTKKKHHPKTNSTPNRQAQTSAASARRQLKPAADVPDDDWTRVDDVRVQPVATTRREHDQAGDTAKLERSALDRRRPSEQRGPQRVRAEQMQGMEHRRIAHSGISGFHATMHLTAHGAAHPAAHVASRSGGRGHS